MPTTQQRLLAVQKGGNLTVADLARWFDRSHPTVRDWVQNGREPSGPPLDVEHVMALLGLLETLIRKKLGFPIPRCPAAERKKLLAGIRKKAMP